MKCINLRPGDKLKIGDATVELTDKRGPRGGNCARLLVDAPLTITFELVRRDDIGPAFPDHARGAQDALRSSIPSCS